MDYDKQMVELENIINDLESGEVGFDQALKMFERGSELCKNLSKIFVDANGKVTVIREELMGILREDLLRSEQE